MWQDQLSQPYKTDRITVFLYSNLYIPRQQAGGWKIEAVLGIFITFRNPLSSAKFEPVNIESSDKHDNH
jgi:hypothetical protein